MFIGHYAVAFAAKKAVPKVSLGTLFLAGQFLDLLWPAFLLIGIEHVRIDPGNTPFTPLDFYDYPISHSLVAALVWSLLLAAAFYMLRRQLLGSVIIGGLVFSHWVLDFVSHRPDLPLGFWNDVKLGLGLWNSVPATIAVEVLLFLIGIFLYARTTQPSDRVGSYSFWILIGVLSLIYLANVFGPPPSDTTEIAIASNGLWLFIFWAYWVDKHRNVRSSISVTSRTGN